MNDYRDYIAHYGVKGMKWHKHLFGRDDDERSNDRHRSSTQSPADRVFETAQYAEQRVSGNARNRAQGLTDELRTTLGSLHGNTQSDRSSTLGGYMGRDTTFRNPSKQKKGRSIVLLLLDRLR